MSTTENTEPSAEPLATQAADTPAMQMTSDTEIAVEQLRALMCGLVVGLLLSSVAFTLFVFKQVRILSYQIQWRQAQVQQIREFEKVVPPTISDLAKYSADKPELLAIFARYGLKTTQDVAPAPGFQPMP